MKIGYARTSTVDQIAGFDAQVRDLELLGCDKIFKEQVSSVGQRPQLDAALDYLRDGDTLVVTKLDRLARSVLHLGQIIERIRKRQANLQIVDLGIDTGKATGEFVVNLFGAVAQFERSIMLERQREGIRKAQQAGKYRGRFPTVQRQSAEIMRLTAAGLGPSKIAEQLGVGRSSIYRVMRQNITP